jgi:flagellar hook protein FlgE
MSILTSLFTGVSGMSANGQALSIIGDNIANSNTTGFKGSRAVFGDMLSQSMGGSSMQIGKGAQVISSQQLVGQGTFQTTSNPLDMAIDGDGFFMVNGTGGKFFTRAGQFSLSKDGYVVNPTGDKVQGYIYDSSGKPTGGIGDINSAAVNSNPSATDSMNFQANLDSRVSTPLVAWTVPVPVAAGPAAGSYNFNSSMTVYDTQGNDHPVSVYFRKVDDTAAPGLNSPNTWQAHIVYNNSATGTNYVEAMYPGAANDTMYLQFDSSGKMVNFKPGTMAAPPANNPPVLPTITSQNLGYNFKAWTGAAAALIPDQTIGLDFGYQGTYTTQYGADSSMTFQNQNGWTSGNLRSLNISNSGIIDGVFTNGQVKTIGQVALARFTNPSALTKMGKDLYVESSDSGQPAIGTPGTSGRGGLQASSLEMSNVDLAEEFVSMISAQRGFQANARVITTTDTLLNDVLGLIR